MRVLIAEDSAPARLLLQKAVEGLGHECLAAADGGQAWELFQQEGAEVVISDWMMPVLEGPELCRRVRAHPAPYTYFIFLTWLEDKQHALLGMQAGADDYLAKPLVFDDLRLKLIAASRVTSLHRELARRQREQERALARREALLRVARRFAAESDPKQVLAELLDEAIAMLGGEGGAVTRWDEASGQLQIVRERAAQDRPRELRARSILPGEGASGLAATRRAAVSLGPDDEAQPGASGERQAGGASIAVPLLHEGRLLGTLSVMTVDPTKRFEREDAEGLELLASIASATLGGLEHARLEGVWLTARTAQHELNNRLAVTVGYAELLTLDKSLPPHLQALAREALGGVAAAARILDQMQRVVHVEETDWGPDTGSTINLAASTA